MKIIELIGMMRMLLPCAIQVSKDINEAKKDDGEVDVEEGLQIAADFFECVMRTATNAQDEA